MKVTYHQVQNSDYTRALGKLATYGGFTDYRQLANIKSFLKQFEKIAEMAQKEWLELLKKYVELNEDGTIKIRKVTRPNGSVQDGFYPIEAKKEEFEAATQFFNATAKEVWADPIPFETLAGVGLAPVDIMALDDLILPPKDYAVEQTKAETQKAS